MADTSRPGMTDRLTNSYGQTAPPPWRGPPGDYIGPSIAGLVVLAWAWPLALAAVALRGSR